MTIRIQVKGLDKVHNFLAILPRQLDKELSKTNENFIDNIIADARRIAPKDTGVLAKSIHKAPVRKGKTVKIWKAVADAPHAVFQEEGFKPHKAYIRNSSKLAPGFYNVKKFTPFMKPALELNIEIWKNHLKADTVKAIRRSKR